MLVEIRRISKTEVTVVSSLDVAETFKKNHRDVMESIRNIETAISTAEFPLYSIWIPIKHLMEK